MNNIALLKFKDIVDERNSEYPAGHLTVVEGNIDVPFDIKRVYYLTKVPEDIRRGFYAHRNLQQVLVCMNGKVTISVSTPLEKKQFILDNPSVGLYIGPMIWREMCDFSQGSVLTVFASDFYNESDYIRDFNTYCELAEEYFSKKQ